MKDPMRSQGVVSEPRPVGDRLRIQPVGVGSADNAAIERMRERDRNDPMWRGYVKNIKAERDAALARLQEAENMAEVIDGLHRATELKLHIALARAEAAEKALLQDGRDISDMDVEAEGLEARVAALESAVADAVAERAGALSAETIAKLAALLGSDGT